MKARPGRWGNSRALRIPNYVAKKWSLAAPQEVRVTWEAGKLIIEAATDDVPTLEEMLRRCDDSNRHPGWDLGPAVGREAW